MSTHLTEPPNDEAAQGGAALWKVENFAWPKENPQREIVLTPDEQALLTAAIEHVNAESEPITMLLAKLAYVFQLTDCEPPERAERVIATEAAPVVPPTAKEIAETYERIVAIVPHDIDYVAATLFGQSESVNKPRDE